MPRTCGVSMTSTLSLRHLRPRPRTVARWSSRLAVSPFTRVTFSFFSPVTISSLRDLLDGHRTLGGDVRRRVAVLERIERRAHDVVRVGRSVALGQDIGDADDLKDRAHRPARDDARAFGRGLHQHARGAVTPLDRVMQRSALEPHADHLAPGLLHRFLHSDRHFLGFPLAHAHPAVAIADHGKRSETEDAAALDDLGHTVDRDHLLAQTVAAIVLLLLLPSHWLRHVRSRSLPRLELEAAFARGIGQRL